ncbi:hypothetical protein ACFUTV_39340 [Streptomyces sp. NPDC057298]|uniref:hypothetical protein n=1 Tax=Streptomyces sp. NPDC057298 TaxID=3346091 RepID=UPI003631C331
MPRGRHRHSPPLHRLLPPSAIAGVSVVCAVGPWLFSEPLVLRGLAAGAAVTAVVGAVVMRRWDASAGRRVADLVRGRASDEWRFEERVAELESDLDESRELRTKLEQRLRAKRAELAGLRNEHAALLRRYATAETERATALENRRLLEIEATTPVPALPSAAADGAPASGGSADTAPEAVVPEATAATVQAALAASSAASVLYVRANAALDRLAGAVTAGAVGTAAPADGTTAESETGDETLAESESVSERGSVSESDNDATAEGTTEKTGSVPDVTAPDATAPEAPAPVASALDALLADDAATDGSTRNGSTQDDSTTAGAGAADAAQVAPDAGAESERAGAEAADSSPAEGGSAQDGPVTDGPDTGGPGAGGATPPASPQSGPAKRTAAKGGARKGSPPPGGPGKGAPRPGGSAKGASAAGGAMTAPSEGEPRQEGETRGKPEAVGGHERSTAATAPAPTQPAGPDARTAEAVRPRAAAIGVTSLQATASRTTPRPAPVTRPAAETDTAHAQPPATEPQPPSGTALVRPTPSEVARVQEPPAAEEGPSPTSAAALTPAARPRRPAGHFTVPTAVAVVPATPARPSVEGGFDFFGTEKGAEALEAVQNEDLADVVGQEALALHKAESEAGFRPAGEESRGVGQVIDLTAHDETEQIDVAELRSAVS